MLALAAGAEIRLPSVLGSGMVVQRNAPVKVWGSAVPGETVKVAFAGRTAETTADASGRWAAALPAVKATAAPLEMVFSGSESPAVRLDDILAGEVWICSGQSNMEWTMLASLNPWAEILGAEHPSIRLFHVPRKISLRPEEDVDAEWKRCGPETVETFSAVAYHFGRMLHEELGVPVGLINASWGGTRIEPWTPPAGFRSIPGLEEILKEATAEEKLYRENVGASLTEVEKWAKDSRTALAEGSRLPPLPEFPRHPGLRVTAPTVLYNGMIHPLTSFPVRGAIWYQGEANRNDGLSYGPKMEALINGWRRAWRTEDFPFYYVQLAPFNYGVPAGDDGLDVPDFLRLPLIWEAQREALRIKDTGMAVITDIADLNDIHPRNKKDVGRRLALWALARTYGRTDLVCSGPLYRSMTVEGGRIRISFDHAAGGLMSLNRQPLTWFEIAGDDKIFFKARAEIRGGEVVVWSARVASPVAVRFGWHQLALPNLGNRAGLPASPFRTDRW